MSSLANVDARLFLAAYRCVSTEETRYYLNGVRIEAHPDKGALLISTDGHQMIVIHDESGIVSKPAIVQINKGGLAACAGDKADPAPRLLVDDGGVAEVIGTWRAVKSCLIDGVYPEWQKIIPVQKWPNEPASFAGRLLVNMAKIAVMLGAADNKNSAPLRIIGGETEADPAIVLFPNCDHAFGIIMPMRASVETGLPIWMKPVLNPKPAAKPRLAALRKKARPKPKPAAKSRAKKKTKLKRAA